MNLNIDLLKYMDRHVRIRKDITHQTYAVAGLDWTSEKVLLLIDGRLVPVSEHEIDLVPENSEDIV